MPATFEDNGLKFQYPENWKLVQSPSDRLPYEISVESPSGSLWMLHAFPPSSDGQSLLREVLSAFEEQYDSLESIDVSEKLGKYETIGHDANFFCLDLLIEASVRFFPTDEYAIIILTQAEDREFQSLKPVFAAITHSFVDNL